MLIVTLRQEIINGAGKAVKEIRCDRAIPGNPDMQMYDMWLAVHSKFPEVRINRNNILSIIKSSSNDSSKTDY